MALSGALIASEISNPNLAHGKNSCSIQINQCTKILIWSQSHAK